MWNLYIFMSFFNGLLPSDSSTVFWFSFWPSSLKEWRIWKASKIFYRTFVFCFLMFWIYKTCIVLFITSLVVSWIFYSFENSQWRQTWVAILPQSNGQGPSFSHNFYTLSSKHRTLDTIGDLCKFFVKLKNGSIALYLS